MRRLDANSIPPELAELKVYFGDANPAEARVYVQLPSQEDRAGLRLTGKVTGPYCVYAHTLAVTSPLRSRRDEATSTTGASLLAEAILPDPCFWSSELPFLYRVQVELQEHGRAVATAEVCLGISAMGARGRDLIWQGKRWVLRGVGRELVPSAPLEVWRELDTALDLMEPSDQLCAEASETGAIIVARLTGSPKRIASRLHEIGRYPAVVLVILQSDGPLSPGLRQVAPNLLLGELFNEGQKAEPSPWANVVICADSDAAQLANRTATCSVPVVAQRRATNTHDLAAARAACDRLQADLANAAPAGTAFAGYIV